MVYVYPAIFDSTVEEEEKGIPDMPKYAINFPDVPGAISQGMDLADALFMAEDALCLMLDDMEQNGEIPPNPTDIHELQTDNPNIIVTLIRADTDAWRKRYPKVNANESD